MMNVKYKILGRWVSVLAILFVSLMPIISQAFEKDQSNNYQVICSSSGLKIIEQKFFYTIYSLYICLSNEAILKQSL